MGIGPSQHRYSQYRMENLECSFGWYAEHRTNQRDQLKRYFELYNNFKKFQKIAR